MNALIVDPVENYTLQYGEKTVETVLNLPEESLTWVVYNTDMISNAQSMIIALRGLAFFDYYVKVIARNNRYGAQGALYFDPNIFNLIGNGYD